MLSSLRRGVIASALALSSLGCVVAAHPAAALDSSACPSDSSTKLLTAGALGTNPDAFLLWVYQSGSDTYLCFRTDGSADGVLRLTNTVALVPPTLTPSTGVGDCPMSVLDVSDPIALSLSYGVSSVSGSGTSVCLGVNGMTVTVTVGGATVSGVPTYELWLDRNSTLLYWYCTEVLHQDVACWYDAHQIV